MMEQRTLGLIVIAAKGLKDVKKLRRMQSYVSVTISGGASQTTTLKTPVDRKGGCDPVWDFPMKFIVDEKELQSNRLVLVFQISCSRSVRGDKEVGEVHVPLKQLLDKSNDETNSLCTMTLQIKVPSSKPQGELTFSYAFNEQAIRRSAPTALPIQGQPAVAVTGGLLPAGYSLTAGYSQMTVLTGQPPLGYPPLGQQVVFPQQVIYTCPSTANPISAFPPAIPAVVPPPIPTVAPAIATDDPPQSSSVNSSAQVLSGTPGVDREKTEYELQLEAALAGLLLAVGIEIPGEEDDD